VHGKKRTTSRVGLLATALWLLGAGSAWAAPVWLAPVDLSAPGRDASKPVVAMDAAGNTVAIWERENVFDTSHAVQLSTRAAGGSFTAPVSLSPPQSQNPSLAMTPGGEAVAVWWHFVNNANPLEAHYELQASTRPLGGSFSAPLEVTSLPHDVIPGEPELAVNAAGDIVLAWASKDPASLVDPKASFIEASVRPAAGSFSTPDVISPQPIVKDEAAFIGGATIDGAGEATVVWTYKGEENNVVEAASRPVGGPFSAPVEVNPALAAGEDAVAPDIAADAAGDVTVVWLLATATADTIESADRVGAGFSSPDQLSESGTLSFAPQIAISPVGAATAIWLQSSSEPVIEASTRPAGGSFSSPVPVTQAAQSAEFAELAMNAHGDAVVVWDGAAGGEESVQASVRPSGGAFSAPVGLSTPTPDLVHPVVAVDGLGDATALWLRSNGTNDIVQAAGYDADAPELRGLSIPSAGTVGKPVSFSVSPFDVWPIGPASFGFGDGGAATGNAVSHVYAAPGTYRVTASATDSAGTSVSADGTIAIRPRKDFTIGKLKRNAGNGTAVLLVTVPGPGKLVLTGKRVRKAAARARKAGRVKLPVRPTHKGLETLGRTGRLAVTLRVSFTPDGGTANAKTKKATLVEKRG
jgi:hypothetical protein